MIKISDESPVRFDTITPENEGVLKRAVAIYGRRAQALKAAEELRELADELELAAHGVWNRENLKLERADVAIMLYQLDNLILPGFWDSVPSLIDSQVLRLKERMEQDGR